jgi:glycine/D-amino acid oxidase-like deaminating enzyme
MSNQIDMGEMVPSETRDVLCFSVPGKSVKTIKTGTLIAGGGIAGSALFRYLSEAGLDPVLLNYGHGASWRNIAGGRPAFSVPELSEIARGNLALFMELQERANIDFRKICYVSFAHDENMYRVLEASMEWQDARMIGPKDFGKEISPSFNPESEKYLGALITEDCWQASPGKTIDLLRKIGIGKGGRISEDTRLVDVRRENGSYSVLAKDHAGEYVRYETEVFINALGPEGGTFATQLGLDTGIYPVRHQAFITRRLPMLGVGGEPLPMLIDRRKYKGFVAVYGQQLADTGQIIGCASPAVDPAETRRNLKVNTRDFAEIVAEVFTDWLPELSAVGFQAVWSGYYVEPRMIIDPDKGLFIGLRGQGFMLAQYLAKMYVDKLTGMEVPAYFDRLRLEGDGLSETAFK